MKTYLGEFEQMVLLAVLQRRRQAYAIDIRNELEQSVGRSVSRGALYRTFDRLEAKGYLEWHVEDDHPIPERGGHPMRRFEVTKRGLDALRTSRAALLKLWSGVESLLEKS